MPPRRTRRPSCRRSRACTTQRVVEVTDAARLLEPIRALHERIRDAVVAACTRQTSELLAAVASDAEGDGDTIYAIDRVGEDTLVQGLADVAREEPLCLMAEGLPGDGLVLPRGAGSRPWCVSSPVPGTPWPRSMMKSCTRSFLRRRAGRPASKISTRRPAASCTS